MKFIDSGSGALKGLVVAALLFGSTTASAAMVCQPGSGCVLPITDAPPPPPPVEAVPAPIEAAPAVIASEGGGIGLFAILAGLAALGLLAFLVFDKNDKEDAPVSP
jgi:hypothetical protein